MSAALVLLGVGKAALAVKRLAFSAGPYTDVLGTTRRRERLQFLKGAGLSPVLLEIAENGLLIPDELVRQIVGADVVVSYPPDPRSDDQLSDLAEKAARIVYISSTGVYGNMPGRINEDSSVDTSSPLARARLEAEKIWLMKGAIVLRAAGLYDQTSTLLKRLRAGTYRLPGDGSSYLSRIHLDDLAKIVLAALNQADPGSTYVVADQKPSTHLEVVQWLCQELQLPIPEAVAVGEVHETLRGNRQICSDRVLSELKVKLTYPTFKEGYGAIIDNRP